MKICSSSVLWSTGRSSHRHFSPDLPVSKFSAARSPMGTSSPGGRSQWGFALCTRPFSGASQAGSPPLVNTFFFPPGICLCFLFTPARAHAPRKFHPMHLEVILSCSSQLSKGLGSGRRIIRCLWAQTDSLLLPEAPGGKLDSQELAHLVHMHHACVSMPGLRARCAAVPQASAFASGFPQCQGHLCAAHHSKLYAGRKGTRCGSQCILSWWHAGRTPHSHHCSAVHDDVLHALTSHPTQDAGLPLLG